MKVKWSDEISAQFDLSNGVKQCAVQSPVLFCIYLDGLFTKLKKYGYRYFNSNTFSVGLGYADDFTLMAPSLQSLKEKYVKKS